MADLTLYVDALWMSPYALSAFVALEEKGLPYAVKEVALQNKAHQRPEYRALTGRVPVLTHGDYWLAESQAICEYLAETFPFPDHPRLYPEDLQQRGRCREVQSWVRSDLGPIREERSTASIFYERTRVPLSSAGVAAVARLLKYCEAVIPEGRTTLFDAWCIADTDLSVMLQRLNLNGDPLPKKVRAYAEANWQRPSVQQWVTRTRPEYAPY